MICAVLFDLDGVLHDRDASVRTLIAQQYDLFAHALRHVSKDDFIKRFMDLDARGYTPKDKVYRETSAAQREASVDRSHNSEFELEYTWNTLPARKEYGKRSDYSNKLRIQSFWGLMA